MNEYEFSTYRMTFNSSVWVIGAWVIFMVVTLFLVGSEWALVTSNNIWGSGSLTPVIEPTFQAAMEQARAPMILALLSGGGLVFSLEHYTWSRVFWIPTTYITHLMVIGSMF